MESANGNFSSWAWSALADSDGGDDGWHERNLSRNGTAVIDSSSVVSYQAGVAAAVVLLAVCLSSNGLVLALLRPKGTGMHKRIRTCNVEKLVGLIATLSLLNGCSLCLIQITCFLLDTDSSLLSKPAIETFCKVQGLTTNLMSLLIIWYEALLGLERYLKFIKPQEYDITFSRINLQIIIFGIVFVLLSVVSGPIYGWGNYAYMKELHSCSFDLRAQNAVTYYVVSSVSYVVTPYIIMTYSCACILTNPLCYSRKLNGTLSSFPSSPWSNTERRDVVLPLALTVLTSFSLQVPKFICEIKQAINPSLQLSNHFLFTATWLQVLAINCCFACALLLCRAFQRCLGSDMQCMDFWRSRVTSGLCSGDQEAARALASTPSWISCPCWFPIQRPKEQKPMLLVPLSMP